ncbi:MAG: insulinase family protein [Candidatus Krumholzibacteria bacterium]|nr:insulinase family protein [Candidatus Krumholzibacteria bacterium]
MNYKTSLSVTVFTLFIAAAILAVFSYPAGAGVDLKDPVPFDPDIKIGKLDNGLTYYICRNAEPQARAELRLVIDAGSILEDEDQLGLAHFVEHMAFNGTTHFAKNELIDYLESIGMKFGSDINASTSFDETVYKLHVPTDSIGQLKDAFLVLEDWAHGITFDQEEIDKERGVIIEEWRGRLGARKRIMYRHYPVLFRDSRYAEHLPIGKLEVIENASAETLKRFYNDWYRPDLMAVMAVGDFDPEMIEDLIEKHFSNLEKRVSPRPRKIYPVPDHDEPLYSIVTDPEATGNSISIFYKSDPVKIETVGDYRRFLQRRLFYIMFKDRLIELGRNPDPPFLSAGAGKRQIIRSKSTFSLGASVEDNGFDRGLEALLTEAERVRRFGFTQLELDLNRKKLERFIERIYDRREKNHSWVIISQYVRHYLKGTPVPGPVNEKMLYDELLPGIELDEVNQLIGGWMSGGSRVILVSAPEKEGLDVPSEGDISAVFAAVIEKEITPYEFEVPDVPLLAEKPEPGSIVSESRHDKVGVTEWTLSNGVRVLMKPTDFLEDACNMNAFSPGGHSLVGNEDYLSASFAGGLVSGSGVGPFNKMELHRMLAGKIAGVRPYIGTLTEGFGFRAAAKDIETVFELLYLYATEPVISEDAYESTIAKVKGNIQNDSASPEKAMQDTLSVTLADYHFRKRPFTEEMIGEIDKDKALSIYRDRFADFGDFTFVLVGNIDPDSLRPLVETYIGGLPSTGRVETWRDLEKNQPRGVIKKTIHMGIEPKSRVTIVFPGEFDEWTKETRYVLDSTAKALGIMLREVMREDMGGTYGVSVFSYDSPLPRPKYGFYISFGCDPDRVDEMVAAVFDQIKLLKEEGPGSERILKIKEIQTRTWEKRVRLNAFWSREIHYSIFYGIDLDTILDYPGYVKALSEEKIRETAVRYLDFENYVQIVLMPEEQVETEDDGS